MISLGDFTGSVGNFGTILPLLVAISVTSGMSLSLMLLLCGGWYILSGIIYKVPVSVEPLKAVAAISIAGHFSPEIIIASGILIGVFFIFLGVFHGMDLIQHHIPSSVVRGLQLGLGFILLKSSLLDFGLLDKPSFIIGILCIVLVYLFRRIRQTPDFSALLLFVLGIACVLYSYGIPQLNPPVLPTLVLPAISDFNTAGMNLVLPQIPITIANAILATSLLISDLYQYKVSPNKLSISVGCMSLTTSMLGGFPLCHGAGGVAAHRRFGGKSGYTMIIGGVILIWLASLFTNPALIQSFPQGLFGVLLMVVAAELIAQGIRTDNRFISGCMVLIAIFGGMALSFIGGVIIAMAYPHLETYISRKGLQRRI
ncbi:putative sulfate/molybdate transporter [uncultured Methanospirillum sp.]|uniref:putative sulfate/molybdate transporter n=1 Tax=uncultured Methanospirillum sp. TaxID=262503 RepID=UPI0029C6439B|nr:putative sulfate/molybdate transporter [uncultured Methanospirillum sp.]